MTSHLTLAGREAAGQHSLGPDAHDSARDMNERAGRVLLALIRGGYVTRGAQAIEMQAALDEGTPYALIHLCDVLLTREAGGAVSRLRTVSPGALTAHDVERARRQLERASDGGSVWQSWQRIVAVLEAVEIAEDAVATTGGQD